MCFGDKQTPVKGVALTSLRQGFGTINIWGQNSLLRGALGCAWYDGKQFP